MISRAELIQLTQKSGLNLYQQEKDYALKLFLFNYYKKFDEAIFKGGTCIKYLYGLNRFSEDLDFNIGNPKKFQKEVKQTVKEMELSGIKLEFRREELFKEGYAAEIAFSGPLFDGRKQTINKFRIDAGLRLGTMAQPVWNLIQSEYPETPKNFLAKCMAEEEMLAEKIVAVFERKKGRDLFDTWFLVKKEVKLDKNLLKKKIKRTGKDKLEIKEIITEKEYLIDMEKLTKKIIPFEQIMKELKATIFAEIK